MFDRFADTVASHVARAWFFVACCALVLVWLPSYFLLADVNTWQLIINTVTTIITFLMVALLQNTQERFEALTIRQNRAILDKLDEVR